MSTEKSKIILFNKKILNWFNQNKRSLPFREDKDPYKILLSEVMAQQTQISTMIPYFKRFLEKFPSIFDLANSEEAEVLALWEGLGYYSRARNLRKTAIKVKELGYFPETYEELIKLPGIGAYTAGAILSIAYNQKIPAVDGNVLRVFSRIYNISESISENKTKKEIEDLVLDHLNQTDYPGNFNEALMELGALLCLKKKPKCLLCPIREQCIAYLKGNVEKLPVKTKPLKKVSEFYDVLIPIYKEKPLFIKRDSSGLLANLYGFPMFENNNEPGSTLEKLNIDKTKVKYLGNSKHIFTHKIWNSSVYSIQVNTIPDKMTENPGSVPTAFKKMINLRKK